MHIIGQSVRNRTQGEGIVIPVKDKLEQYVKINEILFDNIVWIQISKDIFHDQKDMFIGAVYIPPLDSKFHDIYDCDLFLELSNCIAKYTELGNILITGDFNVRTGSRQDYIQNDSLSSEINDHISEIMCYIPDTEPGPRCTMDKKIKTIEKFYSILIIYGKEMTTYLF